MAEAITLTHPSVDSTIDRSGARRGFSQGYVFEILDDRQPNVARLTHTMLLNPEQYILSEPFTSTLTPTEDDAITAEENGIIIRSITLEGTYGYAPRAGNGESGNDAFLRLRSFFRTYGEWKKKPDDAPHISMLFHSMKDDDHFVVVPKVFETPRVAKQTRVHYRYRVQLDAIGKSDRRLTTQNDARFNTPMRNIQRALNNARAYFADLTVDVLTMQLYLANVPALMNQTAQIINAVSGYVTASLDLIPTTFDAFVSGIESIATAGDDLGYAAATRIADLREKDRVGRLERTFRRLEAAMDLIAAYPDHFAQPFGKSEAQQYDGERRLTPRDLIDGTAGATVGSRTRVLLGTASEGGLDTTGYTGVVRHQVRAHDTIDSIATLYGVDVEPIVIMNDLRYPYIFDGGGPGILAAGDLCYVPVRTGGDVSGVSAAADEFAAEDAIYGADAALIVTTNAQGVVSFDIQVDDAHGAGDVALVHGIDNVVQGQRITLNTVKGSTVFNPDVGVRDSVGRPGTVERVLQSALTLREAILADERIESIDALSIVLNNDVLEQRIVPRIVGGASGVSLVTPVARVT